MNGELPQEDRTQVTAAEALVLRSRRDLRVQNLAELAWMRRRFFNWIDARNGQSGSFLGFKWNRRSVAADRDKPAVVVIVPKLKAEANIDPNQEIGGKGRMFFARATPFNRSLWCWTDVIASQPDGVLSHMTRNATVAWERCDDTSPLNEPGPLSTGTLSVPLRSGARLITPAPGALGHLFQHGGSWYGTTAAHVVRGLGADAEIKVEVPALPAPGENTPWYAPPSKRPPPPQWPVGTVELEEESETEAQYLAGMFLWPFVERVPPISYKLDAAVFRIRQEVPVSSWQKQVLDPSATGGPFELNPSWPGFEPLGREVVSVGPNRGIQHGMIVGFSVQQADANAVGSEFADYLIRPLGGPFEQAGSGRHHIFSAPGDSGKGIWLLPDLRPIGILCSTLNHKAELGRGQEFWSVATDFSRVLNRFLSSLPRSP